MEGDVFCKMSMLAVRISTRSLRHTLRHGIWLTGVREKAREDARFIMNGAIKHGLLRNGR